MTIMNFLQWISPILIIWLFSIVALIDLLRSRFSSNDKLLWVLVVLFVPVVGAILYFVIGRKQKIK
jgi:hypothetical protein